MPSGLLVLGGTAALYGVLGVGLGLLLRNQAVAMTVALVWYFVVEQIVAARPARAARPAVAARRRGGRLHPARRPGGRFRGRAGRPVARRRPLLTAYALGLAALAGAALVRRDQT